MLLLRECFVLNETKLCHSILRLRPRTWQEWSGHLMAVCWQCGKAVWKWVFGAEHNQDIRHVLHSAQRSTILSLSSVQGLLLLTGYYSYEIQSVVKWTRSTVHCEYTCRLTVGGQRMVSFGVCCLSTEQFCDSSATRRWHKLNGRCVSPVQGFAVFPGRPLAVCLQRLRVVAGCQGCGLESKQPVLGHWQLRWKSECTLAGSWSHLYLKQEPTSSLYTTDWMFI